MEGEGSEELSIQELASNVTTYKHHLRQVRQLLKDEPGNSEYVDMKRELNEVIALTEELLATAKQNEMSGPDASASPNFSKSKENEVELENSSDQDKYPVGSKVQAIWSEDGEWYDATIEAYTPNGYYVRYDNWGNKEEVDHANIRPIQEGTVNALLVAERVAEATKQAIKSKIAQAASVDFQSPSLPAKLCIDPEDPEDVKATKRKKIHAFKSKMRKEQLEVTQNKRQNAWQQSVNQRKGKEDRFLLWKKTGDYFQVSG